MTDAPPPPAHPAQEPAGRFLCRNCATPLLGDYCHACGERRSGRRIRLGVLAADALLAPLGCAVGAFLFFG